MKKFLFSLGLISILLVTGCGGSSDKLVCTQTVAESGTKSEQKVSIEFKDDKIDTVKLEMNTELEESYLDYKSMLVSSFEASLSSFEEEYGIKPEFKETDKGFTFKIEMNRDQYVESWNEIDESAETREDVKKSLEEAGYTCK